MAAMPRTLAAPTAARPGALPRRLSLLLSSILAAVLLAGGPALTPAYAKPPAKAAKATKPAKAPKAGKAAAKAATRAATRAATDPALASAGVPAPVAAALRRAGVPAAAASFYVVRLGDSTARASWNAQLPMNPASTMKLVTTFAGLQLLGSDYRWQTSLYADAQPGYDGTVNGNVYLRGHGDPKLVPEEMAKLVARARAAGANTINGDLVLDRSYFADGLDSNGTIDGEVQRAYNVGPDALLYAFKTLSFTLTPDPASQTVAVSVTPELAQLKLDNRLTLTNGRCGDWQSSASPTVLPQADGTVLASFSGDYSSDCGEHVLNIATLSHVEFTWGGFVAEWQRAGGRFARLPALRSGKVPRGAVLLARHYGLPLADIVRDINKFSNNVMARQLFLTLGAEMDRGGPASTGRSIRVVQRWLARQGLELPGLVLDNGSGLSRAERISAYDMARLLQQAAASPVGPVLIDSLPVLGVDGTLRNRLTRASAAGSGYLKTGTLADVRALAGYVDAAEGGRYVVVSMINHANAAQAQEAHDALLQWVYRGAH
ncbi:D-alanyl-D-alanine carboxypeptidase/D-alanyl-D-alanine endopeptidase [Cupriavidus sp. SS-3]|uniref:D-alanyl-D-alanine carboxypeptidase/D-alanyl-D-alanine endopeptidase n=1 Tax=Cupriavidus sp. SS-3 TaxID=3109596 RepID=UPI002DBE23B5|nr:D-alanyl-D-alanine carboxypeptidase/D-alanyl-D-alanine-endopeptidase [Cupriavidus sp. SS-3]MEC3769372.1 D-alanyl-D-alanine carboxypeptidase/D-alanyl-D-alanine-endopeptidase [Cupriavidus sp. SS-3]